MLVHRDKIWIYRHIFGFVARRLMSILYTIVAPRFMHTENEQHLLDGCCSWLESQRFGLCHSCSSGLWLKMWQKHTGPTLQGDLTINDATSDLLLIITIQPPCVYHIDKEWHTPKLMLSICIICMFSCYYWVHFHLSSRATRMSNSNIKLLATLYLDSRIHTSKAQL